MAIEPLGSIMTLQAQTMKNVRVDAVAPSAQENNEQIGQDTGAKVDATTLGVAKLDASSDNGESLQGSLSDQQERAEQATEEKIKKAVEQFNRNANAEAVFGIHEDTNRVTIKIVDKTSKKVIKELPPEKTLDMIAKVWEMAGILVDEKR